MTGEETHAIDRLTTTVTDMRDRLVQHLAVCEAAAARLQSMTVEVWGADGDKTGGLKGRVAAVENRCQLTHATGGGPSIWSWVLAIGVPVAAGVAAFLAAHFGTLARISGQ